MKSESLITVHNRCVNYFTDNPSAREGVLKAYYAYHAKHFRVEPAGHNFPGVLRSSACVWCGRSREQVRHDDLPAQCQMRPELHDISEVIHYEEQRAFNLIDNATVKVPLYFKDRPVTGAELARFKQTHGIDGATACEILDIRFSDHEAEYVTENERHSALARATFKPKVIAAK